jgi:hypothetical protein
MFVLVGGGAELSWYTRKTEHRDLKSGLAARVERSRQHCYVAQHAEAYPQDSGHPRNDAEEQSPHFRRHRVGGQQRP